MLIPNREYAKLKESYLFRRIAEKTDAFQKEHPELPIYRMGIGDVTLPLCDAVISALHEAVNEQSRAETFQGYQPECGAPFLRQAIADHYADRGVLLEPDEVFVSSGASDELSDLLDLFDRSNTAMIMEPAYPAYVDTSIMTGRPIVRRSANMENGFLPMPDVRMKADLIYLCSPNNPTGAVYTRTQLQQWVDYANACGAVILFDAAYEAYIEDAEIPRSIYELSGAKTCAIEICSLSKTAGFTGTRLGYTVVPKALTRDGMHLNAMWVRNRTTRTNGVSYILQKGAAAVFTAKGQLEIAGQLRYYKQNAGILMQALDAADVWYTGGKNAPYLWMKCPNGMDSWTFFDRLLKEIQVVGTPGDGFGACGKGFFRFSTFGSRRDTEIAAQRLTRLLQAWIN